MAVVARTDGSADAVRRGQRAGVSRSRRAASGSGRTTSRGVRPPGGSADPLGACAAASASEGAAAALAGVQVSGNVPSPLGGGGGFGGAGMDGNGVGNGNGDAALLRHRPERIDALRRTEQIEQHDGDQDDVADDGEDDALDHKVIALADRLVQQCANAGIAEDHFDQHRARDVAGVVGVTADATVQVRAHVGDDGTRRGPAEAEG